MVSETGALQVMHLIFAALTVFGYRVIVLARFPCHANKYMEINMSAVCHTSV